LLSLVGWLGLIGLIGWLGLISLRARGGFSGGRGSAGVVLAVGGRLVLWGWLVRGGLPIGR
jgi:hypothetical protein